MIGAGILLLGFSGSRWTKFFTERYLSYVASVGVKLFVLYLIMGVGMSIAARWVPIIERGGFSPIAFFYVIGGALVFLFLTWHIPSVAGSLMAGAVSLSLADAYSPGILAGRTGGTILSAGTVLGGAALTAGRWGLDRLRTATTLHTATTFPGRGGAAGGQGSNGSPPVTPPRGPAGPSHGPAGDAALTRTATAASSPHVERTGPGDGPQGATSPSPRGNGSGSGDQPTPPNTPIPL